MANPIGSMTNFPQGFANGMSVRGMPLMQMQPGQVFYVGNGPVLNPGQRGASDSNRGTFLDPFATLNYAINTACTQGRGDIVFVLPRHYESIANATTLIFGCGDVAVVGLGAGTSRPTFIFNTAATANIPVRSSNMSIQNCRFISNFADVASAFTAIRASHTASIAGTTLTSTVAGTGLIYPGASVMGTGIIPGTIVLSQLTGTTGSTGTYTVSISQTFASGTLTFGTHGLSVESNEFRDQSSVLNFLTAVTGNATARSMDSFNFSGNRIHSLGTTAATTALKMLETASNQEINRNWGTWAVLNDTAALLDYSSFNPLNIEIGWNVLNKPNTSSTGGSFVSGSGTAWTGHAHDNLCWQLDATAGIWIAAATKLAFSQNFSPITGAAERSGLINPAAV